MWRGKGGLVLPLALACTQVLADAGSVDLKLMPPAAISGEQAGLRSRVDLAVATPLLQLDVDYNLQLEDRLASDDEGFSQRIVGTLRSDPLDSWLGVTTLLRSDARLEAAGERFRHRLDSVVTRAFAELGVVEARYRLEVDKAGAERLPARTHSFFVRADGELDAGRLRWGGSFRESRSEPVVAGAGVVERDVIELNSSYQVLPGLLIDLASRSFQESRPDGNDALARDERRYRAGFSWQPLPDYHLSFAVDRRENLLLSGEELIRSGSLSWRPRPAWNLELRYADRLQRSGAGVLLEANIDLGSS